MQALVLLSGGLDSVYNLYMACRQWPGQVSAVHFNYGQKAHGPELLATQFFSDQLSVPLLCLNVSHLFTESVSALTQKDQSIPTSEVDIEDTTASIRSAKQVWVPNRNGILLNIAAGIAESRGIPQIIPGFNKEEAETFPDNSVEYIEKLNASLALSTKGPVQVHCFSQDLHKKEILAGLIEMSVPIDKIWSCYQSGDQPCGQCESCLRFKRSAHANSVVGY
jgi:7-cyano-7-deazaguanine synthase